MCISYCMRDGSVTTYLKGPTCLVDLPFEAVDRIRVLLATEESRIPRLLSKPGCFLEHAFEITAIHMYESGLALYEVTNSGTHHFSRSIRALRLDSSL